MGLRKKHRLVVCSLIKKNNIEKLKDYINDNYIVLRLLEYGGSYSYSKYINFLIYAIENNSSLEMMKFIMDECQYETLNFSFRDYGSPLFYAIKSKKLNIADFLIDNGAIINSRYFIDEVDNKRGIFYFLNINPTNSCKKNEDKNNIQKNFDCIDYILNNDFKVTRDVINELIEFNNNNELKYILNELINCKGYTLQYKTRIQLKKEDQKDDSIIDDNVNNIISIDNETIELAIKKENYEALNIIWNYMTNKDELMLINWIYDCIPSKTNTIKNKIFEAYKDQMLKLDIEEQKFNNIIYFSEIRNELKELIHSKQLNELESYIKEKEISPFLIQNNDLFSEDLLIYAIEVESSFEIIKFIVKQYHSLNYTIQIKKSENSQWIMISPLSVALEYENLKL